MIKAFTEESLRTRLGIPIVYGLDAVHGHNNVYGSVILPHNIGLGAIAAGDKERGRRAAYTAGKITAEEMLATGVRWTFAPALSVAEDVRWGRTYESFSENVDIVTLMGSSLIKGLQDGGVAACMKHFLGSGQTVDGRNQGDALLDADGIERILPPFISGIEAGAMTLMPSLSSVNGIKTHENKELLTGLLKDKMGFEGVVVSAWQAIAQLSGETYKEKTANAVNSGIDMIMASGDRSNWLNNIQYLRELVEEGVIPMSRIDDAVMRILKFKKAAGVLDSPLLESAGTVGTKENRDAARNIVADSLVLLRDKDNIIAKLPEFDNILVAGQGANDIGMQCGGWTVSWQGSHGQVTQGTAILEGIREAAKPGTNIVYAEDGKADGAFDAVIAVIGESPYAETEGDRTEKLWHRTYDMDAARMSKLLDNSGGTDEGGFGNINIRTRDKDMLWEVYGYNCPVIVIMLSGRPMSVGGEYENWDAFIAAWLPGTEGGGIADVLFGKRDFKGRTPYTWETADGEVLYPLGFGLANSGFTQKESSVIEENELNNNSESENLIETQYKYKTNNEGITITGFTGTERDIIIPGKINGMPVTVIGKGAFARKRLTSIVLPASVTVIEDNAFLYNRLASLTLPDSVVSVGLSSFANNRLTDITFSKSLTFIGMLAFDGNRLKDVSLPASLTYIGDGAFVRNRIDSVVVPRSVRNFNSFTFETYVKISRE